MQDFCCAIAVMGVLNCGIQKIQDSSLTPYWSSFLSCSDIFFNSFEVSRQHSCLMSIFWFLQTSQADFIVSLTTLWLIFWRKPYQCALLVNSRQTYKSGISSGHAALLLYLKKILKVCLYVLRQES
jgi:hypothetical protein